MNLKQKIFYAIGGLLIGNAILFGLMIGLKTFDSDKNQREISVQEVFQKINSEQIISASFENSTVVFEDINGEKIFSTVGSEPTREVFLEAINQHNKTNSKYPIRIEMKAANSSWNWLVLINALPFAFILFAIFAVIAAYFISKRSSKLT